MNSSLGMINAFDPSAASALDADEKEMIARRQRVLGTSYRLFYQHPVHIGRGEGVWLYDKAEREYL